jgi:hypothetical protein
MDLTIYKKTHTTERIKLYENMDPCCETEDLPLALRSYLTAPSILPLRSDLVWLGI